MEFKQEFSYRVIADLTTWGTGWLYPKDWYLNFIRWKRPRVWHSSKALEQLTARKDKLYK